jgi:hypothetical protein
MQEKNEQEENERKKTKGKDLSKETLLQILTNLNDLTSYSDDELNAKLVLIAKEKYRRCKALRVHKTRSYFKRQFRKGKFCYSSKEQFSSFIDGLIEVRVDELSHPVEYVFSNNFRICVTYGTTLRKDDEYFKLPKLLIANGSPDRNLELLINTMNRKIRSRKKSLYYNRTQRLLVKTVVYFDDRILKLLNL